MAPSPVGRITRGTTGTNRLRRVDRWIARHPALRRSDDPLVVDLGFGASIVTALELEVRLRRARPDVEVLGLEIDPARVASAQAQLAAVRAGATSFAPDTRVQAELGGFEIPLPGDRHPSVIRAFNVLRQYDETAVPDAWSRMAGRLAPRGVLVEGTCDEIGRVATWVAIGEDAVPTTFTVALRLAGLEHPSIAAERLPKALIHHNVPGEPVHAFLSALDREWERAAGLSAFGPVQRWRGALEAMSARWPLRDRSRWRLGEVTVPWGAVAPAT
ncbi:MAG: class I SAM-dependent methyltransferase [Microbacterium sp.]|uniref:class I SAM-dependent methyltransferase n=1 Tax=Microbacterium sp. TaxID=51671 RepID=UPI001AC66985|nr:class I SAM-dependent methyltransferase [Microbacterium sp.]MBN9155171.1 class I SAM-dependent methyltransferase [Microbacterium sp.]